MSGWIKTKDVTVKIHKEYLYTPEEYDDMLEQEWAANAITYTLEETSLPKEEDKRKRVFEICNTISWKQIVFGVEQVLQAEQTVQVLQCLCLKNLDIV
ncbi:MAG: hypothetical protein ACLUR5_16075 [Eubacterium ventriosum]